MGYIYAQIEMLLCFRIISYMSSDLWVTDFNEFVCLVLSHSLYRKLTTHLAALTVIIVTKYVYTHTRSNNMEQLYKHCTQKNCLICFLPTICIDRERERAPAVYERVSEKNESD
jgi:hypothetical protein